MTRYPAPTTLQGLKDFQRRTVDYVFRRLYQDDPPAQRFLVADEVGLGKTLVARGIIAKVLEHLGDRAERIDILYICSNDAIARQNIRRLNVLGTQECAFASRLTLLPTQMQSLQNPVNFISFTPGTTFDLKSRAGTKEERAILFKMLRKAGFDEQGLFKLLQATVGDAGWSYCAYQWNPSIDATLAQSFRDAVASDPDLSRRIAALCANRRDTDGRYRLIGDLRQCLAKTGLDALKPKLIIFDEFQRFRHLFDPANPAAELAQMLFQHSDARVLLLSATPYKMLSLDHEQEDDHYPDFLRILKFLFNDCDATIQATEREIQAFRRALLDFDGNHLEHLTAPRDALANRLRSVMARTERVSSTDRRDAMLVEPAKPAPLQAVDLHHASLVDGVSRLVHARDAVEYWKSAPYALNFMKGYELRRNIDGLDDGAQAQLAKFLHDHGRHLLKAADFAAYTPLEPAHAKLRTLFADMLEPGLWRLLWLPPSLPYWQLDGPFKHTAKASKALVFSAWNMAPNAIAALCSFEAERRLAEAMDEPLSSQKGFHDLARPLRFSSDVQGRLTGMTALLLEYPCPSLASLVDPVELATKRNKILTQEAMLDAVEQRIGKKIAALTAKAPGKGPFDQRWYWATLAVLDGKHFPKVREWLADAQDWGSGGTTERDDDAEDLFGAHLDHMAEFTYPGWVSQLKRPPADLARVLAQVALAGPATNALRALHRQAVDLDWDDPVLLSAAAQVGAGFRTMLNVPESIAILRAKQAGNAKHLPYWQSVLRHGLDGNLAALLDEQTHMLRESLGLADAPSRKRVTKIAEELKQSLSIRTSPISVDELAPRPRLGRIDDPKTFQLRCRFALRFGEIQDEKGKARVEVVRSAFNSPFRPFVLASTSVGQEGLDFHVWCHAVVHWNLPSNPVDLEQREGRVHRYKGLAVRKNVAHELGLAALAGEWRPGADPWAALFRLARNKRGNDLLAYWLFETEGGACIERRVPLLPLSRDAAHLARLKRGLALYRLVFGQPRQEDLLAHLQSRFTLEEIDKLVALCMIDLSP